MLQVLRKLLILQIWQGSEYAPFFWGIIDGFNIINESVLISH